MEKVNKWSKKGDRWDEHLGRLKPGDRKKWLEKMAPLFGVGSNPRRKTQIVIRVKNNPPAAEIEQIVENIRDYQWPLRLDSVVLLTSTQAISVTEHDVHKKDWDSIGLLPADRR
jgi:hypothetical protein